MKLPKDFLWGGSVSAHQTEGAVGPEYGKGPSIYDYLKEKEKKVMSVKKSKFWSLFSLLLCLALAISACSPAGGEATQTQPTETTAAQETAGSEETEAPARIRRRS